MTTLQDKVLELVEDAHGMEENVLRMLDSLITTTDDADIRASLEHHKDETQRHERLLRERLEALGGGTSTLKDMAGAAAALVKGVTDAARPDKPLRNARDGFATEHMEIATYELLERVAMRAGDSVTADVARTIRADEEAMAQNIRQNWEKFVALELIEEQVTT